MTPTPLQRTGRKVLAALVGIAVLYTLYGWASERLVSAEVERYPEVVREVVEPREVLWWGDSVKCVASEVSPTGRICGTVER